MGGAGRGVKITPVSFQVSAWPVGWVGQGGELKLHYTCELSGECLADGGGGGGGGW